MSLFVSNICSVSVIITSNMDEKGWMDNNYVDDIGISTYLSTKQCDIRIRALHWVWVGMGAILLVMLQFLNTRAQFEGHGWA